MCLASAYGHSTDRFFFGYGRIPQDGEIRAHLSNAGKILAFLSSMMMSEMVASKYGTHTLSDHFAALAKVGT
jgi:hypothetical protein